MSKIELETTVGVSLSVERYNELIAHEEQMYVEITKKIHAYQALRKVVGGPARDFNQLEAILNSDDWTVLSPGIAIVISEEDKDWVVPMAHDNGYTLGSWMQLIFDKWMEHVRK